MVVNDKPFRVTVIVISYRRPEGLLNLLRRLDRQESRIATAAFKLDVVVVDNDAAASALPVVQAFEKSGTITVRYVVEAHQGIPIARNAGLASVPNDSHFICFIDDDEWPSPDWVEQMLLTQQATNADCVLGAVIPVYPPDAPKWVVRSRVFESWAFPDQAPLTAAATNNVMVSAAFIRRVGIRFDERMRVSGGSDYLFFRQAVAMGMRIVWSAGAPVYESVPRTRMNIRWVLRRQYRLGNTFAVAGRLSGKLPQVLACGFKGLLRLGLGAIMLPGLAVSPYRGMRALVHVFRGAGMIGGSFGHILEEYSQSRLGADRSARSHSI
ncbi:glycosyltransferase family 2 protein [Arthrobacter sp. W4I7]|uniref:glycosyltransferase family 2 protein n=1 Tax=Arthrobacter sp. W4I7 TaxID=3042296 RepID=UPI00278A6336|nr:glycosyltransferase involved in cell wall biosynthesis [Arthrobacter sp. W4I7]